jgi:hypothetical protein
VLTGGYTISTSGASDPDYTISYLPGTLTITPAPLTITASNASKTYGAALPALPASYSGFVNGESAANLAVLAMLATTASASSAVQPAGYAIIASGAGDPDYTISYQPGTLLITPAPLTITANNASMVQVETASDRYTCSASGRGHIGLGISIASCGRGSEGVRRRQHGGQWGGHIGHAPASCHPPSLQRLRHR